MTDEKYVFLTDCRTKKDIARSARNKRTHAGKRGAVKLPSDYLTKKEWNAMNGTVESYRINDPMTWDEFKKMPDDIKVVYIKALRQKFDVPDIAICNMLGVNKDRTYYLFKKLGLKRPERRNGRHKYDEEGWNAWLNRGKNTAEEPAEEESSAQEEPVVQEEGVDCEETVEAAEYIPEYIPAIPSSGSMVFESNADLALASIGNLLRGAKVRLTVQWEPIPDKVSDENVQ